MMTYTFKGYVPYGAGDMFCLDQQVDYDFDGNVTEEIIKSGVGKFNIIDDKNAELIIEHLPYPVSFVKE